VLEYESQKDLQAYGGPETYCPQEGKNQSPHAACALAVVIASLREYQLLETSVDAGAAIQAVPDDLQIKNPPSTSPPKGVSGILAANPNSLQVPESLIHPVPTFLQVPESFIHSVEISLQVPESFTHSVTVIPQNKLLVY